MFDQIKDNAFAYARLWYKNMDKLIEVMNEHAGLELTHPFLSKLSLIQASYCHIHIIGDKVNFIYSTPECYTQSGFQTCSRLVNRYGL